MDYTISNEKDIELKKEELSKFDTNLNTYKLSSMYSQVFETPAVCH